MKGIILAGGKGLRLFPASAVLSKHLLPIYDKPMIYYPLSTLMDAGIQEILMVVSPESLDAYEKLLGDGSRLGIRIRFRIQDNPDGIGNALVLADEFIGREPVCVILGDNLFLGTEPATVIRSTPAQFEGCIVFGCPVADPGDYGVMEMDARGRIISMEEKPTVPKSNVAVTGLYLFDGQVCDIAKTITKSTRDEFEICDVLNEYLVRGNVGVHLLEEGSLWIDAGTPDRILTASMLVRSIQEKSGSLTGCIEEIAWRQGLISTGYLSVLAKKYQGTAYGQYLRSLVEGETS